MTPTREQELAVLRAVVYASLFDYPLTLAQLRVNLVGLSADENTIHRWWRASPLLQEAIECRDGLYFPRGRGDMAATRTRREQASRELLDGNRPALRFVSAMPFVRMVAVSGSLAHLNAEQSADLDLFVITAPGRVWLVTFTILLVSRFMGWRRRLCMNYVISEKQLAIVPADMFSANQIIHLQPLVGHDVFERFLAANPFVEKTYPNFTGGGRPTGLSERRESKGQLSATIETLVSLVAPMLEHVARAIYGWHLGRKSVDWQSRDQVRLEAECLKLHTHSHRASIIERFEKALAEATAGETAVVK